jgi:hypothetical protein
MIQSSCKLGKLPPRHDRRTLRFARYVLPSSLPPLPQWVRWSQNATQPWGMMLNDRLGDCTCAGAGHAIQTWSANHGNEITLADSDILSAYSAISGYDPATGANDNGAVELDVLNYWRNTGVGGHRIGAFVSLQPQDQREVQEAIYLFGGVYIGLALPAAIEGQSIWKAPHFHFDFGHPAWQPGSWGGHAVFCIDFDAQYVTCVTWGALLKMDWAFFATYCDEAYGIISPEWVNDTTKAPNGFDMFSLNQDLQAVGA